MQSMPIAGSSKVQHEQLWLRLYEPSSSCGDISKESTSQQSHGAFVVPF